MATAKISFSEFDATSLASEIARMEAEFNQMKFDHAVRGMANPMEIRESRRNIARAKTEARSREVAAFTPEQVASRSKIRARRAKR